MMIGLHFEDFKRLADGKRVYFFKGDNYYDFLYLVDGILVKTTVKSSDIVNPQQFFSDKMFYGATQLSFRIPDPESNIFQNVPMKSTIESPIEIEDVQTEEVKNTDIQRESVQ